MSKEPPPLYPDVKARNPQGENNGIRQGSDLTEEENKVLNDLSSEAFWQRALPLGIGAMFGMNGLVRAGVMKPHPKFGALPKMMGVGCFAYFIGKLSYIPTMQNQIMERIPHSKLAAQIRKAKNLPELEQTPPQWEPPAASKKDLYPAQQPQQPGLDEMQRPSMDREVREKVPVYDEKKPLTYDDIRRRNRDQYESKPSTMPQIPPNPDAFVEPNQEPPREAPPQEPPARKKRKNIWGDDID